MPRNRKECSADPFSDLVKRMKLLSVNLLLMVVLFLSTGSGFAVEESRRFLNSVVEAHSIKDPAQKLNALESIYGKTENQYKKFIVLRYLARAAVDFGDVEKARRYSRNLLLLSESYRDDWNYGNAIHDAFTVLGWISLEQGDVGSAISFLQKACDGPSSPQLSTFGPTMFLAKKILDVGEEEAVIDYLQKCRKIWTSESGRVVPWIEDIRSGKKPDFDIYATFR